MFAVLLPSAGQVANPAGKVCAAGEGAERSTNTPSVDGESSCEHEQPGVAQQKQADHDEEHGH